VETTKNIPEGHVREDIEGAPYAIGQAVTIVFATDETFDQRFMGRTGVIVHYDYSCGCGQSFPRNPMIGVQFESGEIEEFWKEEMTILE